MPADKLIPCVREFEPPSLDLTASYFRFCHAGSERGYAGDGLWVENGKKGELQLLRFTSRRVLAYLAALDVDPQEVYAERAREGLELLLRRQQGDGSFLWYNHGPDGPRDPGARQYEGGIAGRAFIAGYEHFEDERYLEASRRLVEWELASPLDQNNNYNMFAVWHMAAHYRVTGEREVLESAVYRTREAGLRDQEPSGGWPGHNSWIWYHSIIVRGLAELISVMPPDHLLLEEFRGSLVRAVNRMIRDQTANGYVAANPGSEWSSHGGYSLQAFLAAGRHGGLDLDSPIHGLAGWMMAQEDLDAPADRIQVEKRIPPRQPQLQEPIWVESFEEPISKSKYGELPPGWFVAWHPGYRPDRRKNRITRNTTYPSEGNAYLELTSETEGTVCWGIGKVIPEEMLRAGSWYRFSARLAGYEPVDSDGRLYCVLVSVRFLDDLKSRDLTLPDDERALRAPSVGYYTDLSVNFRAREKPTAVYVWFQSRRRPEKGKCGILVDSLRLQEFVEPPGWLPDCSGPGASEMLAMAEYWRWRMEKEKE